MIMQIMVHGFGWDLRSCTCHKVPHKAFVAVVQSLSFVQLFVSPWTQHSRFPYPSLSPRVCSDPCPLKLMVMSNHLIPSPLALNLSQPQGFFSLRFLCITWSKYWTLDSASVLPVNIHGLFPLGQSLYCWSTCY